MKRLTKNRERDGFTLVELLMVIVIIGMLGTISISVLRSSLESAKTAQTQMTISKIDSILTGIYEKYQYRRVEMPKQWKNNGAYITQEEAPLVRLWLLRELIRMDMPQSSLEVENESEYSSKFLNYDLPRSALNMSYYAERLKLQQSDRDSANDIETDTDYANAELLYLIVTNGEPDSRSMFTEREIGDVNGNGLSEFVDAWDKPIQWLRWAPGLPESDRQALAGQVAADDFDPLDPLNVGEKDTVQGILGWFLAPFVVSGGSDGVIGLEMGETLCNNSPFSADSLLIGTEKVSPDGSGSYHDNIHNHTLVR